MEIKIGDTIRSEDFNPVLVEGKECYMSGRVVGIDETYIHFIVEKVVWCDEAFETDPRIGTEGFTYKGMYWDWPTRLQVIK
jgi:hypothetical protein